MNNLAVYIGLIIGIYLGYHEAKIKEEFTLLKNKILEKRSDPTVVSTRPDVVREDRGTGAVVSPKTPYEIEFQENEEIRRMNPGS